MSKKNSSVNLKKNFKKFKDLLNIFHYFEKSLNKLKTKTFLVAVSGGPDSLALAALTKLYSLENSKTFYYVLINHNIRTNSEAEAKQVKNLLKDKHATIFDVGGHKGESIFFFKKNFNVSRIYKF